MIHDCFTSCSSLNFLLMVTRNAMKCVHSCRVSGHSKVMHTQTWLRLRVCSARKSEVGKGRQCDHRNAFHVAFLGDCSVQFVCVCVHVLSIQSYSETMAHTMAHSKANSCNWIWTGFWHSLISVCKLLLWFCCEDSCVLQTISLVMEQYTLLKGLFQIKLEHAFYFCTLASLSLLGACMHTTTIY